MSGNKSFALACPAPLSDVPHIRLAHGGGGRLMHQLLEDVFLTVFDDVPRLGAHDGAELDMPSGRPVMTTDGFVVHPLFFPGGDIGTLAANGTVNDLAMCGARPLYLSASFILEEGLDTQVLWRVVTSMRSAADAAGVRIVTGDTKVVERGRGDGVYITTTGIGVADHNPVLSPTRIGAGDVIIVSRDIGRHGMAVMGAREGLEFSTVIESDCAPLWRPVDALLSARVDVHCLRDVTRGGLGTVVNELAEASGLQFDLVENHIPVAEDVRGACEVLGFDPLQVASEGCFVAVVSDADKGRALETLKNENRLASIVGRVVQGEPGLVTLETPIGGQGVLDLPAGELLPRIC